jgi:SAM-dependent methyltransferase
VAKVFDRYARYYDLLYRDKDYHHEAEFIMSLLKDHAPRAQQILELGCGTGIHAQMIAEAGYHVSGIDFSDAMLDSANNRRRGLAVDLGSRLVFDKGDVRTYRAGRKFDAVLSLFHVFSYQTTNTDLNATFRTASEHLDHGGTLIFDYWYGPAVLSQRPETRVKRLRDEDMSIVRVAESTMNDTRNTVEVNYETMVHAHGAMEVIHESHRMRYLFIPEIEMLAEMHGLECVTHQEWLGDGQPSARTWSAFSVMTKR